MTLGPGSVINGTLLGRGNDAFQFGGTGSDRFNVGTIGTTQQHQGFATFTKTGISSWTLTGSGTQNWTIQSRPGRGSPLRAAELCTLGTGLRQLGPLRLRPQCREPRAAEGASLRRRCTPEPRLERGVAHRRRRRLHPRQHQREGSRLVGHARKRLRGDLWRDDLRGARPQSRQAQSSATATARRVAPSSSRASRMWQRQIPASSRPSPSARPATRSASQARASPASACSAPRSSPSSARP